MIQRFCDRCGEEMNNDDGVSSVEGYVLIKTKSGSIMDNWDCVDLCEKCKKKLYLWLMMQDSTSAMPDEYVIKHQKTIAEEIEEYTVDPYKLAGESDEFINGCISAFMTVLEIISSNAHKYKKNSNEEGGPNVHDDR